ncbi:hypothetical protein OG402_34050 [Streptomyces anulatus]|uniref:hypothetical protein n=1 Tax=Streptomyces anulatus TaxID=1892 RepID=UPI0022505872|nr:hypothetical protein [Streptomyces anulatus]MCX4605493.1 hypothetical protein [Streptomyces anulatus]
MIVTQVHEASGSHIEPPLDQAWDELTKLTWKAAVVTLDTGLDVAITEAHYFTNGVRNQGFYNAVVGHSSIGPLNFRSTWDYLSGVSTGATQASRRRSAFARDPL